MAPVNLQTAIRSKKRLAKNDAEKWLGQLHEIMKRKPALTKKELLEDKYNSVLKESGSRITTLQGLLTEIQSGLSHRRNAAASLIPFSEADLKKHGASVVKDLQQEYLRTAILHGKTDDWERSLGAINKLMKVNKPFMRTLGNIKPPINALHHWAYATYMVKGNTPELRGAIRQFSMQYPNDTSFAYWGAHYNIMAGNYIDAFNAIKGIRLNKDQSIDAIIRSILDPSRTKHAYVPYPCNFYTYRYTLMSSERIIQFNQLFNRPEFASVKLFGTKILSAYREWNSVIDAMNHQNYSAALSYLSKCRKVVLDYLLWRHDFLNMNKEMPQNEMGVKSKLQSAATEIIDPDAPTKQIYYMFRRRYSEISLHRLHHKDWERPMLRFKIDNNVFDIYNDTTPANNNLAALISLDNNPKIREKIDAPLILLGMVFIPLATIEAYRQTRQYDSALNEVRELLKSHEKFKILSEFIEVPFVRILAAQIMLEKADAQYKSGEEVVNRTNFSRAHQNLKAASTYKAVLDLCLTLGDYVGNVQAISDELRATMNSLNGLKVSSIPSQFNQRLNENFQQMNLSQRLNMNVLGKNLQFPQFDPVSPNRLAVTPNNSFPARNILRYSLTNPARETNPLIYAIVLEAKAKLLQINSGFNYLGYSNDYIPPWKFSYLLDRARYYADQAKALQRDYLNFISNAEREQFQEMNAAQNVTMERMNVAIDEARVEQSRLELTVAKESEELANLQAVNSEKRLDNYVEYDKVADLADILTGIGAGGGMIAAGIGAGVALGTVVAPGFGTAAGAVAGTAVGILAAGPGAGQIFQLFKEEAQREMEKKNLALAVEESKQNEAIAEAQVLVAEAALEVMSLQAQASVMRHEFAIQSYEFLRNRLTNAELWFRLAHSIRAVANTYLRRAIEISFLAEQVYETMVDKRINVIRFDYDNSNLGDMLGADFLKGDLDYLESHLITTQKEKQQQVKCVISLARDFPQALQELGENESVIIPITLEYLEQRFPGLYKMKISAVELQPLCIMDPTRFNAEMSYMGSGLIRVKSGPVNQDGTGEQTDDIFKNYGALRNADGLISAKDNNGNQIFINDNLQAVNPADESIRSPQPPAPYVIDNRWILQGETEYPVRSLLRPAETAIFSGLTAAEETTSFQSFSLQQKNMFEDCPAAAGWRIDMSMTGNRVVRGSLADMVIKFYVTGYYDSTLKNLVEDALRTQINAVTRTISAKEQFSDEFFNFCDTGKISFDITPNLLTVNEKIGELKELGIYFMPGRNDSTFNRFSASYLTEFTYAGGNIINETDAPPRFRVRRKTGGGFKEITITVQGIAGKDLTIIRNEDRTVAYSKLNCGNSEDADIVFTKQGRQQIVVRLSRAGITSEFSLELFISAIANPILPVTAYPLLSYDGSKLTTRVKRINNAGNETDHAGMNVVNVIMNASGKILSQFPNDTSPGIHNPVTLNAGEKYYYIARFSPGVAATIGSYQVGRSSAFDLVNNKLSTNKAFAAANSTSQNDLTDYLFGAAGSSSSKMPLDKWTFDLQLYDDTGLSMTDLMTILELNSLDELLDSASLGSVPNSFIYSYDCNGNLKADLTIFQDSFLFLEYELKRRVI